MRSLMIVALLGIGCSVEVGKGHIAPITVDVPLDPGTTPPISMAMKVQILSAAQAADIARQYGGALKAVEAIDLSVDELGLTDGAGKLSAGTTISVHLETMTISRAGQRVRLPDDVTRDVVAAIRQQEEVTAPVQLAADWPATESPLHFHGVLQPIVIVNALEAL
jgi:hypothetical protein